MNLLFQVSRSVARHPCARRLHQLTTTSNLLTVHRNKLSHYNRLYCCHRFMSNASCFQYRRSNNVMNFERKGFLIPEEKVTPGVFYFRGMAGHSKWQNIRHVKGEKDKQKGDMSMKFAQRIRLAIKDGGSSDVKFNSQLERVIVEAKKANMSMSLIENAIKGASTAAVSSTITEIKFTGNCILVVEICTTKPKVTKNEMQTICKKNGGKVETGCSTDVFDKKGIIHVTTTEKPDMDLALELAIEVGAEDVSVESDEDNVPYLEFTCGQKDLHVVRRKLEAKEHEVTYCEYEYLPTQMYPLDEHAFASLEKLINKLYQHQDVVKVFDNATSLE